MQDFKFKEMYLLWLVKVLKNGAISQFCDKGYEFKEMNMTTNSHSLTLPNQIFVCACNYFVVDTFLMLNELIAH